MQTNTAFDKGKEAWYSGDDKDCNPYPVDTDDHVDWNIGYNEMMFNDVVMG